MTLHPTIKKLLCKIALLPSADNIVVFGSVATGTKTPADLDVCLRAEDCADWASEVGLQHSVTACDLLDFAFEDYGWLDPFVKTQTSLNVRNDQSTGWTKAKNATKLEAEIRAHGVPIKVVISRVLRDQSFFEDMAMDEDKAALWRIKWEQNGIDKVESFTMSDGKEIVAVLLDEFKLPKGEWVPAEGLVSPWDYMRLDLDGEELSIGVSAGGVVSVNRRSHTPDDMACHVTLDAVRRTLRVEVKEYLQVLITKADTAAFSDLGHSQEGARVIRELSEFIQRVGVVPRMNFPLKDANGNQIGMVLHSYSEHLPYDDYMIGANLRVHLLTKEDVSDMLVRVAAEVEHGKLINNLNRVEASMHVKNLTAHLVRCLEDGWSHVHQHANAEHVFKEARGALSDIVSNEYENVRIHELTTALERVVEAGSPHINNPFSSSSVKTVFANARDYLEKTHVIVYDHYESQKNKVLLSNDGQVNGVLAVRDWPQVKVEAAKVQEQSLDVS